MPDLTIEPEPEPKVPANEYWHCERHGAAYGPSCEHCDQEANTEAEYPWGGVLDDD